MYVCAHMYTCILFIFIEKEEKKYLYTCTTDTVTPVQ